MSGTADGIKYEFKSGLPPPPPLPALWGTGRMYVGRGDIVGGRDTDRSYRYAEIVYCCYLIFSRTFLQSREMNMPCSCKQETETKREKKRAERERTRIQHGQKESAREIDLIKYVTLYHTLLRKKANKRRFLYLRQLLSPSHAPVSSLASTWLAGFTCCSRKRPSANFPRMDDPLWERVPEPKNQTPADNDEDNPG